MKLNDYGKNANGEWVKLTERFKNFELDVYQIMPNHMHGIIVLSDTVGATLAVAPGNADTSNMTGESNRVSGPNANGARVNRAPTMVGNIVGAYKSLVANRCLEIYKTNNETMGKLWQRNYYEHIIRNDESYQRITDYILNNPANWRQDKLFK